MAMRNRLILEFLIVTLRSRESLLFKAHTQCEIVSSAPLMRASPAHIQVNSALARVLMQSCKMYSYVFRGGEIGFGGTERGLTIVSRAIS